MKSGWSSTAVFTQGQAGKAEHLLVPGDIPVVQTDRGGQVTYHGPGQLVAYLLLDVRRLGFGVRELVSRIEQTLIDLLASYGVQASAKPDAPGVYVDGAKIASLGLRIRNGRSFHGLALNVDMDLAPFRRINPCGYAGLAMTQLRDLAGPIELDEVGQGCADSWSSTSTTLSRRPSRAESTEYDNCAEAVPNLIPTQDATRAQRRRRWKPGSSCVAPRRWRASR